MGLKSRRSSLENTNRVSWVVREELFFFVFFFSFSFSFKLKYRYIISLVPFLILRTFYAPPLTPPVHDLI